MLSTAHAGLIQLYFCLTSLVSSYMSIALFPILVILFLFFVFLKEKCISFIVLSLLQGMLTHAEFKHRTSVDYLTPVETLDSPIQV